MSLTWNLHHVTPLAPGIFRWLLGVFLGGVRPSAAALLLSTECVHVELDLKCHYFLHGKFDPRVIFLVFCLVTTIAGGPFQPITQSVIRDFWGGGGGESHEGNPVSKEIWFSRAGFAGKTSRPNAYL